MSVEAWIGRSRNERRDSIVNLCSGPGTRSDRRLMHKYKPGINGILAVRDERRPGYTYAQSIESTMTKLLGTGRRKDGKGYSMGCRDLSQSMITYSCAARTLPFPAFQRERDTCVQFLFFKALAFLVHTSNNVSKSPSFCCNLASNRMLS